MDNYLMIKIKKKYAIMIGFVLILLCGFIGYYFWCAAHPMITITTKAAGTHKEGINMEAPQISLSPNGIAEPLAEIELKLNNIMMQHEFLMSYICNTYHSADIKLDMKIEKNKTILYYHGMVASESGKQEKYENTLELDYAIDAEIQN